ncbi:hypothetical protein llap_13189 [Limosa lapponica baueri]|uniref:Uncharacterized protein n=1 Tax=Limosa lapponica baueri TaxID=1758121 RepID=A0A2I0TRU7_LIMLA|nr:hypothetical protein llap_13189 [Limosa lapponica baueri]
MGLLLTWHHVGELSGHRLPLLLPPLAEARRFQKDVADGIAVTVPVGHVALSAKEQRNVEAFGNGKTKHKEPVALHPWLCAGGCLLMERTQSWACEEDATLTNCGSRAKPGTFVPPSLRISVVKLESPSVSLSEKQKEAAREKRREEKRREEKRREEKRREEKRREEKRMWRFKKMVSVSANL